MGNLFRSTAVVGFMTGISRILGFFRDVVIARVFGAGPLYDAFLLAFRIPNLFRRLFAEGAFSQAFIPVLTEYKQESHEETQKFINKVSGTLAVILSFTVLLGIFLSPYIIKLFAPGIELTDERFIYASEMLKITFPYLLFISLTAFAGGILNTHGKFAAPAITPIFLNIAMIISVLIFAPMYGYSIKCLAFGVFLGGILQLGFQIPFLMKIKLLPVLEWGWSDKGVQKIIKLMIPSIVGVAVHQINLLVDMIFASFLIAGSISWLYYADRLMELPLGMFGVAIATVSLPNLSKFYTKKNKEEFHNTLGWAVKTVFLIGTPSAVGLFLLAEPTIITLFFSKAFTTYDVQMSSLALKGYVVGMIGLMLVKILASGYYAQKDTKTPVKIAIATLIVNVVLNSIFISRYNHVGLAMATSCSSVFNAFCLFWGLTKRKYGLINFKISVFLGKLILANLFMAFIITTLCHSIEIWLQWGVFYRVKNLVFLIGAGAVSYLAALQVCGLSLKEFNFEKIRQN